MIQIQFTAGSPAEAQRIATLLVEKCLVACATCIPNVLSIYRWENQVETNTETKVLLKTAESRFSAVEALIRRESSYDLPEILFTRLDGGSAAYMEWLQQSTS